MLNLVIASVPVLRNRFHKNLLTRLRTLHKSELLESNSDTLRVETLSLQSQPVSLSTRPTLSKERANGTGAKLVCWVRAACYLFKVTKSSVPSVAKRMNDKPATLGTENPWYGEGKLLCPKLSPNIRREPTKDSRSAKQDSRRTGYTKNSNSTTNRQSKGGGNSVAGPSDVGTDDHVETNLAAMRVKCIDAFLIELVSKLDVDIARSKMSRMDLQNFNQLVRDKVATSIFKHAFAAAQLSTSTNCTIVKQHMYSEVRWELINKLNELIAPQSQFAASLEDVTNILVVC